MFRGGTEGGSGQRVCGGGWLPPLPGPLPPETETEDYPLHAGPGVGGFMNRSASHPSLALPSPMPDPAMT